MKFDLSGKLEQRIKQLLAICDPPIGVYCFTTDYGAGMYRVLWIPQGGEVTVQSGYVLVYGVRLIM